MQLQKLLIFTNKLTYFAKLISGNPCSCLTLQLAADSHYSHANPSFNSTNQSIFPKPCQQGSETSCSKHEDKRINEKSQEDTSELFTGFLTIGTLGAETSTEEPATPAFAMPLENITEGNAALTENDLKLISYELEKFLETEEEEERSYESSGRNSHISTITLSSKRIDGAEDKDNGKRTDCPLQGYLFGSSIEFPVTTDVRKERVSLGELFHRTKITNQDSLETRKSGDTQAKQTYKPAMHIVKKMVNKVLTSSKSYPTTEGSAGSTSTNKKLHKVSLSLDLSYKTFNHISHVWPY